MKIVLFFILILFSSVSYAFKFNEPYRPRSDDKEGFNFFVPDIRIELVDADCAPIYGSQSRFKKGVYLSISLYSFYKNENGSYQSRVFNGTIPYTMRFRDDGQAWIVRTSKSSKHDIQPTLMIEVRLPNQKACVWKFVGEDAIANANPNLVCQNYYQPEKSAQQRIDSLLRQNKNTPTDQWMYPAFQYDGPELSQIYCNPIIL